MNRLFEIASELNQISVSRMKLRSEIDFIGESIIRHEAEMIPEGGWPGSNADTRKAMEKAAKASDLTLQNLANGKINAQSEMDALEIERDALIAERDAYQWTIRDRENVARGVESVFVAKPSEPEPVSDEQAKDNLAASARLFEMDTIADACKWDKMTEFIDPEVGRARARYRQLEAEQAEYEQKYNL